METKDRRLYDLPMNVTDDCDGRANVHDVGFSHEDFLGFLTYLAQ